MTIDRDEKVLALFMSDEYSYRFYGSFNTFKLTRKGRTEAAAVTEDEDMRCCLDEPPPPPPPRPSFVTDHPFMFMIREYNSATPFFIGLVFNPLLDD
ncbi:hypothetical protein LguiB_007879 [Lonicera macranthoides]